MDANAGCSRIRAAARRLALRCARRCCCIRPSPQGADADERRDWSGLPEDLMLIAMASMEVPDLIISGAVCSSWRTAYNTFRRLRLPTPNQPPCLLYAPRPISDEEDDGGTTMMLYSPSTDVTFCVQPSSRLRSVAGSAYGWMFATDEAANPYLVNPLTGAEAALPPITTLERVNGGYYLDGDDGGIVYNVEYGWANNSPDTRSVTTQMAIDDTYQRVAMSAAPAAAGAVVLLVHMPYWEVSFARVGDDRWTSISRQLRASFIDITARKDAMQIAAAAAAGNNHVFYLMSGDGFVYVVDLAGPAPVVRSRTKVVKYLEPYMHSYYLVVAPTSGELLLVTRNLRREHGNDGHRTKITTAEVYVEKIDLEAGEIVRLDGIGKEHALFLGHGSPVWVPAAKEDDGGHPLLRPNCVYLTDGSYQWATRPAITREDFIVWDFESCSFKKLAHAWPHLRPWLDEPAPIWITPSLY